jgi:CBS domain-containing protein
MDNKFIPVRDVMHTKHIELDGLATVKEALDAMRADKAEVVIVKKRHANDALGMVLLSDIAKLVLAKNRAPERVNLYEIMSKPIITVEPDLGVRYCARLFDNFGLGNVPVVENGLVIGIVSYPELVFDGLCKIVE